MDISKKVLLLGFFLMLLFPVLNSSLSLFPNENTENTRDVIRPKFDLFNLKKWIVDFDVYYKKNFSGRTLFFQDIANLKYHCLNASVLPDKVIAGKDGFLFLGNLNSGIIDKHLGIEQFSTNQLNKIRNRINQKAVWFEEKGVKFYMAVAPNKCSIYPEKMPFYNNATTMTHQIFEMGGLNCPLTYLSPKEDVELSDTSYIYIKKNTHWNSLGAFYGYDKLVDLFKEDFPSIQNLAMSDYKEFEIDSKVEDISLMLNLEFTDKKKEINQISNHIPSKKMPNQLVKPPNTRKEYEMRYKNEVKGEKLKVIVIRDSFCTGMIRYFNQHFAETVFIWTGDIDLSIIEKEKPDIVVYEFVERSIRNLSKI